MKKVFLVLMMMSVMVFSREWSLMGSNEKDVNGTEIMPKNKFFIEVNKLSADNFNGHSIGWGNGLIFEYMSLSGSKDFRYVKSLEYEVSYYKIGFDTSRMTTQPVSLGLLGGLFYGDESVKSFSLLNQTTLGVFVGLGIKGEITDSLALHGGASYYSGWNEDFTRRAIYSYGFKYVY